MLEKQLTRLHDLAVFLAADENLEMRLGELAKLAAQATDAASCSVMLLSEGDKDAPRLKLWASSEELPASAWSDTPGTGESIAGKVLQRGTGLLVSRVSDSEFADLARRRTGMGENCICVPITVGSSIIGVMNLDSRFGAPAFTEADLSHAGIVAVLIGKAVQVERLQTLLRSRVAQASLAREGKEVLTQLTDGSPPPTKLAKILAKAFYKDLSAAGFGPDQIIEVATEIIGQLSTDIGRHKKRLSRLETGSARQA
jgi:transcriptional regulator with GAF, ATPase, and Fis domain